MSIILISAVVFFVVLTISLITMNYMRISNVDEENKADLKTQALNILMNSDELKKLKKYVDEEVNENTDKIKLNKTRLNVASSKIQKLREDVINNKKVSDSKFKTYDDRINENKTKMTNFKKDINDLHIKHNVMSSNLGEFNFQNYQAFVNDVGAFKYGEFLTLTSNVADLTQDLATYQSDYMTLSNDLPNRYADLSEFNVVQDNQKQIKNDLDDFKSSVPLTYSTIESHNMLKQDFDGLVLSLPTTYATIDMHDNIINNVLPNYLTNTEFSEFKSEEIPKLTPMMDFTNLEQRVKLIEEEF